MLLLTWRPLLAVIALKREIVKITFEPFSPVRPIGPTMEFGPPVSDSGPGWPTSSAHIFLKLNAKYAIFIQFARLLLEIACAKQFGYARFLTRWALGTDIALNLLN